MPAFPIQYSTPIGNLRTLTQSEEVAPRATVATGVRTGRENQLDLQAISAEAANAGELSDTGTQLAQVGAGLIQSYEKLRQAREVLEATDIANRAILSGRQTVQTLRTSNIPIGNWMGFAEAHTDQLFAAAIKEAGSISPAAAQHVQNQLEHERLSLLTAVSGDVAGISIKQLQGLYEMQKTRITQDFNATRDPVRRTELATELFGTLRTLESTGVVDNAYAERERRAFVKQASVNRGIEIATEQNLDAAVTAIQQMNTLDPDEKREAVNRAKDSISERLAAKNLAERQAEKQLAIQRTARVEEYINFARRPESTIAELQVLEKHIPDMVSLGEIDEPARLRSHIEARRKELANPTEPVDNEELKARVISAIVFDARSVTPNQIQDLAGITWKSKQALLPMLKQYQQSGHFSHTDAFKDYVNEIRKTVPPEMKFNFGVSLEGGIGHRQEVAIQTLRQLLEKESAQANGILSDSEVRLLAEPIMRPLIKDLETTPAPSPSKGAPPFESIQPAPKR